MPKQKQRDSVADEIRLADTTKHLAPDLTETELIQQLVLQFLQHDGYVETAREFAKEIHAEKTALRLNDKEAVRGINIKDDEDANNRQRIRRAILEGDIDKAMEETDKYYPTVLRDNEQVYFRLRCRKFIEMIRKEAELNMVVEMKTNNAAAANNNNNKNSNGQSGEDDEEMLDDDGDDGEEDEDESWEDHNGVPLHRNGGPADSASSLEAEIARLKKLSQEAILYGQELRAQFSSDARPDTAKHLDEIFSLIAYSNPLTVPAVAHLLDGTGRVAVSEELNSAILSESYLEHIFIYAGKKVLRC